MKSTLLGALGLLVLLAAAGLWVWHRHPEHLPEQWRRANPHSRDYAPALYRWRDSAGRIQLTDTPPSDRPYETVRIDPNRNIVPSTLPPPGATR